MPTLPAIDPRCKGAIRARQTYHDADTFVEAWMPERQNCYLIDEQTAYMGSYPTITDARLAFGENSVKRVILRHGAFLNEFTNVGNKLNPMQLSMLADTITANYYWLKLSELMLFFAKLEGGMYGKFYGAVDNMAIMDALHQFTVERRAKIATYEQQAEAARREREQEERRGKTINYDQWQQLKKQLAEQRKQEQAK